MKRLFAFILFSAAVLTMQSQDFILTVDGKCHWSKEDVGDIEQKKVVTVEEGRRILRVPTADIVLIEYKENGVVVLKPDNIKKVDPVKFNDENLEEFLNKGKRVYIPYSSRDAVQRCGSKKLRELVSTSNYWEVVYCEDEADFILEYVFDDSGKDHAYLLVSDRFGNYIFSTFSLSAGGFTPNDAGGESAEKLYKRILVNIIFKGKLMKKTVKQKKRDKHNHGCPYYLPNILS